MLTHEYSHSFAVCTTVGCFASLALTKLQPQYGFKDASTFTLSATEQSWMGGGGGAQGAFPWPFPARVPQQTVICELYLVDVSQYSQSRVPASNLQYYRYRRVFFFFWGGGGVHVARKPLGMRLMHIGHAV